jgi:hypothetical protein
MTTRGEVLRKIAEHQVGQILPHLDGAGCGEYATAVVRQWVTCDGRAAILTERFNHWLAPEGGGERFTVSVDRTETSIGRFAADWHIPADQIPELLHRLSVAQSAEFQSEDGLVLRLRVVPHERAIAIEQAEAEGD